MLTKKNSEIPQISFTMILSPFAHIGITVHIAGRNLDKYPIKVAVKSSAVFSTMAAALADGDHIAMKRFGQFCCQGVLIIYRPKPEDWHPHHR
jgi:hypothetical protein